MPNPQPFCYPVCDACRVAACPKAFTPKRVTERQVWAPRNLPPVTMACGCRGIPWPCISALGKDSFEISCPTHGWVRPVQEVKKTRKQVADETNAKYPELPPF